jgi:hypothetical protein
VNLCLLLLLLLLLLLFLQNAVTFQAQGVASRLLTGSTDKSAASWQVSCLAGMFAGAQ